MDLGLSGKVAIIGGSSKGMGRATAIALAREGSNVAICARTQEDLERTAADIRSLTSANQVLLLAADLSVPDEIDKLVEMTIAKWGRVDIVVNNVRGPQPGQPTEFGDDDWYGAFELSFFSAVRMCKKVLPFMKDQKWGRIISILSLSIKQPEDNLALSTTARAATAAYMKTLASEVASERITVNTVLPGSIATDRLQGVWEMQARFHGRDMDHAMEDRLALIPTGRFGKPEEVGDLICFLASDRAGFITGLHIPVDGGQLKSVI